MSLDSFVWNKFLFHYLINEMLRYSIKKKKQFQTIYFLIFDLKLSFLYTKSQYQIHEIISKYSIF
jgi:hypothetical protein